MSEKEDQGDPADAGDCIESAEYEDDFEKDLEYRSSQEEAENLDGENPENDEEDIEKQIFKAADSFEEVSEEAEENLNQLSEADINEQASEENLESRSDTKQEDCGSDIDSESSIQESELENQQELDEEEDEEIKRYILEKIEEANKQLENQAPVDQNRERKLKFKDKLVDLEVPPLEDAEACKTDLANGDDVSSGLSQLHISNDVGQESTSLSPRAGKDEEKTDVEVLVEKDGKFELLSLRDIESEGFLPPISVSFTDIETQHKSPKSSHCSSFGTVSQMEEIPPADPGAHSFPPGEEECEYCPKPPPNPKHRPTSAVNVARGLGKQKTLQRAQSANVPVRSSTYCLSPRQKELQKQLEQRKEKLRKEEEERKREQEEQKRRENEMVFKAWLQKKKEQVQEERRIRRAKELEDLNSKQKNRNPEEAFKLWLKKKHQEHMKEKQIEILRRQAEGVVFFQRTEECNRAFKEWLKRKREEKRAEELAAKERARQRRLEARRAKQMQNIHYI
ncbi:PREDICTED: coiled-coil domain-containing protein 181 [Acanthisitta chloris]|uniref:Coiled-coil domain-containing protein 181 n=1 Tax=Acanthisitta chloris TaxID=57068 RepID=A0A091MF45_9PASS|nr:PREDICTED: coiled-coil domain-containing protein 181 [Acanthisitta chloris]KFP72748.1 Coiled-coil domain-containing protein 181 [Acanthisitta chloris]